LIEIAPVTGNFVAEVAGVDLTKPVPDAVFAEIEAAFERYAVLVFPDQPVDDEQQLAFTARFGPLETNPDYAGGRMFRRREVADFTNVAEDDRLMAAGDARHAFNLANQLWHTDSSFKQVPAKCSLLSAREIAPVGGQTEYADMRAAWDALPAKRQAELEDLVAEHSIFHSRRRLGFSDFNPEIGQQLPPVRQRLVRHHPASGRTSLYLAAHASHIVGWPETRGAALIDELIEFATQPRFVYSHRWRKHDLVLWDNRCTMHRGRPWDAGRHRRVMHNTKAMDAGNTVELAERERAREAAG
jgi:alpha-ketoglutarate-dependent 2,4-dichlorophenoxyacetate dioxygenase